MKWESYHTRGIAKKYLYKFLSFENAQKFLQTKSLWFSRASEFGDKMECVLMNDLQTGKPDLNKIVQRKNMHLISCWHLANNESLAMWDTYAKSDQERRVCALQFDRRALVNLVTSRTQENLLGVRAIRLIHGKVAYKNILDNGVLKGIEVKYGAFRKEAAFRYESEYRFVIQLKDRFKAVGLNYFIGPNDMPFKLLINPLLSKEHYLNVQESFLKGSHSHKVHDSALAKWLKPHMW